jgi:hypothetical protein
MKWTPGRSKQRVLARPALHSVDLGVLERNMSTRGPRLLVAVLVIYCGIAGAQENAFSLEGRDPGVERWISYAIVGPSNSPNPFVYLSTQSFITRRNEFLTVLPKGHFDVVSKYTQAWIDRGDCPGEYPRSNDIWYSVKISRRDRGPIRYCILPRKQTCAYLGATVKLVHSSWTADELRPLTFFEEAIHCDAGATQSAAGSDRRQQP